VQQITHDVDPVQLAGWILGFVGGLFIVLGALARYIWGRHVAENDNRERANDSAHGVLHRRIDEHLVNHAQGRGKR
jgi:hypothetical protein